MRHLMPSVPLCETRYGPVGNVIGMLLRPGSRPARAFAAQAQVRAGVRLAVDVGSVRIGVARRDPAGVLASPLTVVKRGRGDLDTLAELTTQAEAIEVV